MISESNLMELRHLPLLEHLKKLFSKNTLDNVYLLGAQHLVSTSYALFNAFFECGLSPDRMSVIGKCYSTDPKAFEALKNMGIDVCDSSMDFDPTLSFDQQYSHNIKQFFDRKKAEGIFESGKKIIILDDGGFLLEAANEYASANCQFIGIEQTTSGYAKLSDATLKFPVVNLARSFAKLDFESPIIGRLVKASVMRHLDHLPYRPQRPLVIGNGAIGKEILATLLQDYPDAIAFDVDPSRSQVSAEAFSSTLSTSDLIIGCTGKTVIPASQHKLLQKNTILISASSSDREFDAVFLRNKGSLQDDCHSNLHVDGLYLLNSGFPINFDSHYQEIDHIDLQFTRTLLFASVMQAALADETDPVGFIPFRADWQREIIDNFLPESHQNKLKTNL